MKLQSEATLYDNFRFTLGTEVNFFTDVLELYLAPASYVPDPATHKRKSDTIEVVGEGYLPIVLNHQWVKEESTAVLYFNAVEFEAFGGKWTTKYWVLRDFSHDILIAYGSFGDEITITDGNILSIIPPKSGFLRLE